MHKRILIALVLFLPTFARAAGLTDYSSHKPPSITLPSAGHTFTDPVFGTTIIRATDSSYGTRCVHAYSYWPAFNYNNTRLLLACDKKPILFKFDPTTDKLTYDGLLIGSDGPHVEWQGATWSQYSADVIYALDLYGLRLWKMNVAIRGAAGYGLITDFTSKFGTGVYATQLTTSANGDVFSFHTVSKSTGARLDSVVYVRSLNKTYVMPRQSGETLDETKIDKDGQYMMANFMSGDVAIWNFAAGSLTLLKKGSSSDMVGGHYDIGFDYMANSDGWHTGLVERSPASLHSTVNIVRYKRPDGTLNWTLCDHVSLREKHETFVVGSTYCGDGSWAAFEKEIYLAFTDGHGFVRLAHSRSVGAESDSEGRYWAQPRAVVSRDGHYIVWTTDMGSSTRLDVMIVKVPSAYWPY